MTRTATAFNPSTKGASVTLSGSNLIATVSSGTGGTRVQNAVQGLIYFEMTLGATLSGSSRLGIAAFNYNNGTLLGAANTGIGYDKGGTVVVNNATVATIMTYAAGDRIGVAFDPLRQLIWFRKNNGNWNNDILANQNPVGAVGGITTAGITSAFTYYATWSGSATSSVTGAFASGSWVDTAPTGFVSLDADPTAVLTAGVVIDATSSGGFLGPNMKAWPFYSKMFQPGNGHSPLAYTVGISGKTYVLGVLTGNILVRLYDSFTGELLDQTYSDGSGDFSFIAQSRDSVYAMAQYPTYQAIVYDQLVPA